MTRRRSPDPRPPAEPTLTELRAFVAVAEELHFRRAALRLGVAPPPLSQTIRRLEEKLGSPLMIRTPREVVLTPAGLELLPRARDILARMAQAQMAVDGAAERVVRPLRVGIMSNGFGELTGPILETFRASHPRVRIELVSITSQPGAGLLDGEVDVALLRPPVPGGDDPSLAMEDVVMEERAALLSRRHPLAEAERLSIADLLGDPWVATGPTLPEVRDYWAAAEAREWEPVRFDVEAWSVPAVMHGVGYQDNVITSCASILRFFRVPEVRAVPLSDVAPAPMTLGTRRNDRRRVVSEFGDTVRRVSSRMIDLVPGAFITA